jgi:outer membrane protein TolC
MIKYLLIFFTLPLLLEAQSVKTIGELFDSLKTHPVSISDEINMQRAEEGENIAYGNLYPKINLFGKYDWASNPTGMRPMTLNEMFPMIKDQTIPQPLSQNILRAGAMLSMPLFVKSIYTMASKAKMMYKSAESKKYINLMKNEAIIASANANLKFIEKMELALENKKKSINTTRQIVGIKVNNGRVPKSALLKINTALNNINIIKNKLDIKKEEVKRIIAMLTGIYIDKSINMEQTGNYTRGRIMALNPLYNKLEADRLTYRAEKEKLWPVLMVNGSYNHSWANAYNNGLGVQEDFANVSLTLAVPLLTMSQYSKISKAELDYKKTEMELRKMDLELRAQAKELESNLPLLENSISLYRESINNKEKLLNIAKAAYETGRMSIEDYLRYEDDLVMEKANLYKTQAEKWQTILKLAVIFGNNIEGIVK